MSSLPKNKIAIVGAGFAGLATAWFLLQKGFSVTLFDEKGIGGGASGAATGLLHPYPGEQGRKSWRGEEGMAAAKELIGVAENALGNAVSVRSGVIRQTWDEMQANNFRKYGDVEELGEGRFHIKSGMTIHAQKYLEGLWAACKGASLELKKINALEELSNFSSIVIAAGAGSFNFAKLQASQIKGQSLVCRFRTPPPISLVAKGYIAVFGDETTLGSTYERDFSSDNPNREEALKNLLPKAERLIDQKPEIVDCKAGIRVAPRGHYRPITERIGPNTWIFTGLGSRGLLYHALLARELVEQIAMR